MGNLTGTTEQPQPTVDPTMQRLFESPQQHVANPFLGRGSLVQFSYLYWAHDPRPLVIVTDVKFGKVVRGINIHYLTFNHIKKILQQGCDNVGFSYKSFMGDQFMKDAFRSYKWAGVRQIKKLNCDFIQKVMELVRSFDPAEVEIIRKQVLEQLNRQVNITATEAGQQSMEVSRQTPAQPIAPAPVAPVAPAAPAAPAAPMGQQVLPATQSTLPPEIGK